MPRNPRARSLSHARRTVRDLVWSRAAQAVVVAAILINAVSLGAQTMPLSEMWQQVFATVDGICLGVFVLEISLKIYADRSTFFRNGWNIFDASIVALGLLPAGSSFTVLRAFRVFRVLRLISVVPSLRRVVDGLGRAVPGILSVATLLGIVYYVGAVMATTLYGEDFPELFGDLGASLFTLFQLMTFDDWGEITRQVTDVAPLAPLFFITFVFASALTVLNLVVAVIVDAMQGVDGNDGGADDADIDTRRELVQLRADIARLMTLLESASARPAVPENETRSPVAEEHTHP